jgi:hypothetical protein
MLIQMLAGAFAAQLLKLALGPGAAEPRAIGGGFLFRPLLRNALPELLQVDQIPHAVPRHACLVVVETKPSNDERVRVPVSRFGELIDPMWLWFRTPHDRNRSHADFQSAMQVDLIRSKYSGYSLASSMLIYEFPIMQSDRENVVLRVSK